MGWGTAIAAFAVSTAALGLVIWVARFPIGQFFLSFALADRGIEADYRISELDLSHAVLSGVRVGAASAPDFSARTVVAAWRWNGLAPELASLRFVEPKLRTRMDMNGRVSAGALDHIGGAPSGRRLTIPRIALSIDGGVLQIDAPFGALVADVRASGVLGESFTAMARLRPLTSARAGYAVRDISGAAIVVSRDGEIGARISSDVSGVMWDGSQASDIAIRGLVRAPLDLSRYELDGAGRIGTVRNARLDAQSLRVGGALVVSTRDDSLLPAAWRARAQALAGRFASPDAAIAHARFEAEVGGRDLQGQGRWSMDGDDFSGFALSSARAAGSGAISLNAAQASQADISGVLNLGGARLDRDAERIIDGVLPHVGGAPIEPTFAQAHAALKRAGRNFNLAAPFHAHFGADGQRIVFNREIAAQAASGLRFSLAPLRVDAPALTLQWPNAELQGAVDLEISGGGAPTASMLLDSVHWAPGAPLDGEGTLALSHWRTVNASLRADQLDIGISIGANGAGRVDLHGPAVITGPFADGQVRDMVAQLDIGILWGDGWRIVPNSGCLPISLGGLDTAGLSFQRGRFALCASSGALAGADAHGNLGGGFSIEALALDGRMAGPDAQPVRLTAGDVVGRFHGRGEAAQLSVVAHEPALAIAMAPERALTLRGAELTANARLVSDWRIEGEFREGALSDPALPGTVTAIAGRWNAAPENDKAIVRVEAGEALLNANRPASDEERPLFHTLRIADFSAILRNGEVDAQGALVLAEQSHQLAHFTAHHNVEAGAGSAFVASDALSFDRSFQPYQISELARGFIDNVRGNAAITATIDWTREAIAGRGIVHLNGVSLSTATIPVIEGVRGDIAFDDLFHLTTPPGQQISIDTLNPGLAVHNGRVRFQLLPERRVKIEQAEFDFASGTLAMTPTTIPLGTDETHFELSLRNLDAAALLATLNIPDITATGKIDGDFPLLLTRRSALIQNGELHAQQGGGTLSYTGHAGDQATGAARIAFDALKSFRYDDLSIALNGDLSGELVSSIQFHGHNSGRPVDLGPIMPGLGHVSVRGVPFAFQVHVTAPFRSLAETAGSISNPSVILNRARNSAHPAPPPVDQSREAPR